MPGTLSPAPAPSSRPGVCTEPTTSALPPAIGAPSNAEAEATHASSATSGGPTGQSSRTSRWYPGKWITCAVANRERGMSTAEYAVGTIAACAFAALLFKVVSSPEVQEMLKSLIDRALKMTG
ncbi:MULTISPECIES: DUF4244 domain-containing protein [unclassified Nonomuraea]|uniref:DUF4244 domain-containing protein n=1 Tax=unclassified Nonomuraea TaxID=2593643 RepID=UPI0033EFA4C0